ncbi:MAG: endonuclease/exonuclease/phosphatase family protein [Clostridia bacterium]|nr:endonuclease/exonuclease/phosphatase family protein [Clostridia bacterium]
MKLKTATYNIAAGLSGGYFKPKDYLKAADVIKRIDADVIALNEVGKPLPDHISEHTEFLANRCGYKYYFFAKAASYRSFPYGNAVLSKFPIDSANVIPLKKFKQILPGIYEPRCILTAEILSHIPFRIICTHLGLFPDEQKLGILKAAEIAGTSQLPTVLMGDLNISGNKNMFVPFKNILNDVCDLHGVTLKTFPAHKPQKRLDYIFVSNNITVENVEVVSEIASDHLPLVAFLDIQKTPSIPKR